MSTAIRWDFNTNAELRPTCLIRVIFANAPLSVSWTSMAWIKFFSISHIGVNAHCSSQARLVYKSAEHFDLLSDAKWILALFFGTQTQCDWCNHKFTISGLIFFCNYNNALFYRSHFTPFFPTYVPVPWHDLDHQDRWQVLLHGQRPKYLDFILPDIILWRGPLLNNSV